jgi:hypothetical protein
MSLTTELYQAAADIRRGAQRMLPANRGLWTDMMLDASRLDDSARRARSPEARAAFRALREGLREEADTIVDDWIRDAADPTVGGCPR